MSLRHRRRAGALVAVAAAAALVLSACGSDAGGDDADASKDSGSTYTVKDTFLGDVKDVPTNPKRVVALWRTGSELAELGVVPVGAMEGEFLESELGPGAYKPVANVPTVGTFESVDVEKVIAAKPDLIIGMDNGGLGLDYKELQEVAPTVIMKIAEPPDVWANYPKVAKLVGKSSDFEKRDAELDKQLAAIKSDHGDAMGGLSVTSLGAFEDTIYVDTSKALNYERLTAAGFGYNPKYTDNPERYVDELSQENIASLADQDIIFYDTNLDGTPTEGTDDLLKTASFKRLPAAKAGHVYPLTSGTIYTFAAAEKQVEDMRKAAEDYESSKS